MLNNYIDRRVIKSKQALKNALLTLLQHKSFNEITITNIVREADLNRGTFYKHYQYKEEILSELFEDVTVDLTKAFRAPYEKQQVLVVRSLNASTIKIFDHVANYSTFYSLLGKTDLFTTFQQKICNLLKELQLSDLHDTQKPMINKEILASYRAYATLGLINDWVNEGFKYSTTYMAEQLVEILYSKQENETYQVKDVLLAKNQ